MINKIPVSCNKDCDAGYPLDISFLYNVGANLKLLVWHIVKVSHGLSV